MGEETCPRCSGNCVTERSHYEVVTDPDGKQRTLERHTIEPCSYCNGSGRVS